MIHKRMVLSQWKVNLLSYLSGLGRKLTQLTNYCFIHCLPGNFISSFKIKITFELKKISA